MTYDGEDDLFDEEFDFVDEDDDLEGDSELEEAAEEEVVEEKPAPKKRKPRSTKAKGRSSRGGKSKTPKTEEEDAQNLDTGGKASSKGGSEAEQETAPEPPPGPPTDHVVHLYEFGDFTRTIPREFTAEDAAAFAKEYNRTANAHSRHAVASNKDEEVALSVSRV